MKRLAFFCLLAALAACDTTTVDHSATAARAALAADRELARQAAREGAARAFSARLHADSVFLSGNGEPRRGDAALEWLMSLEDALEWMPQEAWGAASGELAVTRGRWTTRGIDDDGNPRVKNGNYLSVWRKNAAGEWQVMVDMRGELN